MRHWYVILFLLGATAAQRALVTDDVALANIGRIAVFFSFAYIATQCITLDQNKWMVGSALVVMLGSKALGPFMAGETAAATLEFLYLCAIAALFFRMGVVEGRRGPTPVLRQFLMISAVSLPVMLLQNLNWPDWISFLNTQKFLDGVDYSDYIWPLFVDADDPPLYGAMTFTQARPAGITWSNAYLAFLVNAALFILLFLTPERTRKRYVLPLYFSSIWCMGKVTLLGTILLTLVYFWTRTRRRGTDVLRCTACIVLPLLVYYCLLPGFFEQNLSIEAFSMSVMSRVLDTLVYFHIGDAEENLQLLADAYSYRYDADTAIGGLSGAVELVFVAAIMAVMLVLLRLSRSPFMTALRSELSRDYVTAYGILFVVTLLATPLLVNPLFWLLNGVMIGRISHLAQKNVPPRESTRGPSAAFAS